MKSLVCCDVNYSRTVEDNIIQTVLVNEVSHLCSSKRVGDGLS